MGTIGSLIFGCSFDLIFVNAYCPQGPQWSSFDKSILELICELQCSILHLPMGFGNSFRNRFFNNPAMVAFMNIMNMMLSHYIVFRAYEVLLTTIKSNSVGYPHHQSYRVIFDWIQRRRPQAGEKNFFGVSWKGGRGLRI